MYIIGAGTQEIRRTFVRQRVERNQMPRFSFLVDDGEGSEAETGRVMVRDADGVFLMSVFCFMGCSALGPSLGHPSHPLWAGI